MPHDSTAVENRGQIGTTYPRSTNEVPDPAAQHVVRNARLLQPDRTTFWTQKPNALRLTISHRVTDLAASADSKGKTREFANSYSPRAEPAPAGSRHSLLMHVSARMHAADGPRAVHKAAAIQSRPKTALSMRPRSALLPLEAEILTFRYRKPQGLATQAARQHVSKGCKV